MKKISRRNFLRTTVLVGGASIVAACKPTATAVPTTAPVPATAVPTTVAKLDLPFQVAPEAVNPFNLATADVEGVFFAGGFGDDYIKYAAQLEQKLHPGTTVKVQSIQKITEQLQPRFVAGNPPDVIDNSGANMIPISDLVRDGQVYDMTELLNAPALDTPGKKVSETLFLGSQDNTIFDGKPYGLNIAYTISGTWYFRPYPHRIADRMVEGQRGLHSVRQLAGKRDENGHPG
jgi:ABC-type glycerol-3-phosphate transport system substrate-binding protein